MRDFYLSLNYYLKYPGLEHAYFAEKVRLSVDRLIIRSEAIIDFLVSSKIEDGVNNETNINRIVT
jgi:hypothetical protein